MNVLSLFDGISCARVALDYAKIDVNKYYSCEIDKYAMNISKKNYPSIISLGSVIDFKKEMIKEEIDLLIGGSPCQDLSIAKKDRQGLKGDRSSLFFEYVRIMKEMNPKYFILENVASMKAEDRDTITGILGVEPVMFNASLISAQNRKRYFWTNIKFDLPIDRRILLKDILEDDTEIDERFMGKNGKALCLLSNYYKRTLTENEIKRCLAGRNVNYVKSNKIGYIGKSNSQAKTGLYKVDDDFIRKLTPIECERLQSLPDNYTEGVSNTQRYKCLGNAFNCEVIAHILKSINV
jgi:DNA-cytosine methyltransferase